MKTLWMTTAAAALLISTSAMAQTGSAVANNGNNAAEESGQTSPHGMHMRADIQKNLQQSGFTDVKVVPDSFLVQAKDKSGNPVTMFINPDSVTELVAAPAGQKGQEFVSLPQSEHEHLTSKLIGTTVYNDQHQDLGTIKDVATEGAMVQAYILNANGRTVAVSPSALNLSWDHGARSWKATMNATEQQVKSAPEVNVQTQG